MPNKCCVYGCTKTGGMRFPTDPETRKRWLIAVKRDKWVPNEHSIVCHAHFRCEDYHEGPTYYGRSRILKKLKPGVVPSIFKGWSKRSSESTLKRQQRVKRRKTDTPLDETDSTQQVDEFENSLQSVEHAEVTVEDTNSGGDADTSDDHDGLTQQMKEYCTTGTQIDLANSPFLSIESLEKDPELLHYYTGLESVKKFLTVFQTLGPAAFCLRYLRTSSVSGISPVNQFLLMLARLRQDLDYLPLSRMCGISLFTVENVFLTWINFCSRQWGEIDTWTEAALVRYFCPSDFKKKYPSTRVILDGTEVPVERPSNPAAQRASFSSYKNRNTVKTVVGATPSGLISFISPVYGGSASDRQIIERSDLADKCNPGDSVMADKGFNVQDLFAANDVKVNIPAFFKKKNRLTEAEVLNDRKVSSKRVHIERIIGMAKTYKILATPLSASETKLARHILRVCFQLYNFRSNIVSRDA